MTPQEIIACVRRLDECADQTIGWMARGGVCCLAERVDGYCTNPCCRDRAIHWATVSASEAGHSAHRLIRLSEAAARAEGTPVQLFDPQEFERRVAFMEGRKR
jgi:hypothetical protein